MTAQEFYSAHQTTLVNVPRVGLLRDVAECVMLAGTAVLLLWLFTGCAHVHLLDAHEAACKLQHYCGPNAGQVVIGDTICYTNDVFTPDPIDNKDLKCH